MKKRIGRPPSENPRTKVFIVRLRPDERKRLKAKADQAGKSLSAYLREKGLAS